jgi:hypothetical protein
VLLEMGNVADVPLKRNLRLQRPRLAG